MDRRMRINPALICFMITLSTVFAFIPGIDGKIDDKQLLKVMEKFVKYIHI